MEIQILDLEKENFQLKSELKNIIQQNSALKQLGNQSSIFLDKNNFEKWVWKVSKR